MQLSTSGLEILMTTYMIQCSILECQVTGARCDC